MTVTCGPLLKSSSHSSSGASEWKDQLTEKVHCIHIVHIIQGDSECVPIAGAHIEERMDTVSSLSPVQL